MEGESLFQNLPTDVLSQLYLSPIQSQCFTVKMQKSQSNKSIGQSQKDQYIQIHYRLQIRLNYVLQVENNQDQIISGFQCHIDKTFKLLRASTNSEDEVGELTGIEFRSASFSKQNIYLYLPQISRQVFARKLQNFAEVLGRKYIIQDGFHDIYRAVKKIGKGVTASVYKSIRLTDQKELAVKSFKKDAYFQIDDGKGKVHFFLEKAAFQKEFKVMTEIDSKYVTKLVGVYESQNSIYIVMELLARSLYGFLKVKGILEVEQAKQIMKKLLIGLKDIHSKNIMHRDLKLENIMILQDQETIEPKIIDFGLAQHTQNQEFIYLKCGTPGYVAPQILNLNSKEISHPPYSLQCDIFSMGVIFYMLLSGKVLFDGADEKQVVKKNKECQIDFDFKDQNRLTEEMKDLLRKMLQQNPKQRQSAESLLSHSFFQPANSCQMEEEMEQV